MHCISHQLIAVCVCVQYAPILFDGIASGSLGPLLNTVIIGAGEALAFCP